MARTTLNAQQIIRTGLIHTFAAVDQPNGNQFANDGQVFQYVKNGGAVPTTVTIPTPGTVDGLAVADLAVTIAAGVNVLIGPFPPGIYNQANGMVYVDYSVGTSVTVAVVRL